MWWAEHIVIACCSCAHRSSPSNPGSPNQSILKAKICRVCKICILTESTSKQIYATWASPSLIFLKNRNKGTAVLFLLDCFVKQRRKWTTPCRTKHCWFLAGNHLVDARWPNHDHILTVGLWKLPALEGPRPAADTLLPWILFVPYQKSRAHP